MSDGTPPGSSVDRASRAFAPGGSIAKAHPGFEYRAGQRAMAEAVAVAFDERTDLLIEAGTGTGKTLAYLIPALDLSEPVILSTGTKALQQQLLEREALVAVRAAGRPRRIVLLKGRANYVCLKKLDEGEENLLLETADEVPLFARIREWVETTETGDRAEIAELPDASPLWGKLDARSETCTGAECSFFDDCFAYRARRAAERAHLVVVNHHLLFAELALREGGFGRVLPDAPYLVIDEAHLIEDIAATHFGHRISSRMVSDLAGDATAELQRSDRPAGSARALERAGKAFFAAVRPDVPQGAREGDPRVHGARTRFDIRAAGPTAQGCADALAADLDRLAADVAGDGPRASERALLASRAESLRETLTELIDVPRAERVLTVESRGRHGCALASWPIEVGPRLERAFEGAFEVVVATSATLSVCGQLTRSARRLGLGGATGKIVRSPFRLAERAAFYVPREFPEPRSSEFARRSLREIEELVAITEGRALVLFASHRALSYAADALRDALPWRVLVQGDAPREQLIETFRADTHSILLGTASFRQGIDVPGASLSLVIVDKLPFAVPSDPLVAARGELMRSRGEDPFNEDQLPSAILALRQALGRLVRRSSDRGLLALLDVRVRSRRYGRAVLESLPDWPLLDDLDQARSWFRREPEAPREAGES